MKVCISLVLILSVLGTISAQAALPHLDPEMTGFEYRSILNESGHIIRASDNLKVVLETGKRNLEFFDHLNSLRPLSDKMELWTEANTIAYPMHAPSIGNRDIIRGNYDTIVRSLPTDLKKTLLGNDPFPTTSGLSDSEYLEWSRKLDRAYQSASRWILMEPYLGLYAQRAEDDVRGYAFFRDNPDAVSKLPVFHTLPTPDQDAQKKSLIQICMNSGEERRDCVRKLNQAISDQTVTNFYLNYLPEAKAKWDGYFKLGAVRNDIRWNSSTDPEAYIPFLEPQSSDVKSWLTDNIQDEWKWSGFQLKLEYKPSGNIPYVRFVPGATANVNGLGGNRITMDANRNIHHYSQKWIIRHEFGHVLGFTDCYVEFYDESDRVMINYQLDITDLMCSRRGKLKETHYLEMKKHYRK